MRHVGDLLEQALHGGVDALQLGVERLDPLADLAHARLLGARILAASLGAADGLGSNVALGLQIIRLFYQAAALGIAGDDVGDQFGAALLGERTLDVVGMLPDEPQIEHEESLLRFGGRLLGLDARDRADTIVGIEIDDTHAHRVPALRRHLAGVDADDLALRGDDQDVVALAHLSLIHI